MTSNRLTLEGFLILSIKKPSNVSLFDVMQHSHSESTINTSPLRSNRIHTTDQPNNSTSVYQSNENENSLNSHQGSLYLPSSPTQNYLNHYAHPHSLTMRSVITTDDHRNYQPISEKSYHHLSYHPSKSRIDMVPVMDESERQSLPLYAKSSKSKLKSKSKTFITNSTEPENQKMPGRSNSNSKISITNSTDHGNQQISNSDSHIVQGLISNNNSKVSTKFSTLSQSISYLLQNFYCYGQQRIMKIVSCLIPSFLARVPSEKSDSETHLQLNAKCSESVKMWLLLLNSYYQRYILSPTQPMLNQIQDLWTKFNIPIPNNWQYTTSIILPLLIIGLYNYRKIRLNNKRSKQTSSSLVIPSELNTSIIITDHS